MSDDLGSAGPAPAWLCEPLLQPGERVVLWGGPRDGRLLACLRGLVGWLKVKRVDGFLAIPYFGAIPAFAFGGIGLFKLLGWSDGGPSLYVGLSLALVWCFALLGALIWAEQAVFHVLTDRRFLVIKAHSLVEAFDLDLMRRLVAAADAARPAAAPADEHLLDPSKLRAPAAPPAGGVTELDPLLRMMRAFGQLQAPAAK